jgi:hypothetical protein
MCVDESLADCSAWAILTYALLPMAADREGRLEYRPKRIKAQLFPYHADIDIEAVIQELAQADKLVIYEVDGAEFIQLTDFAEQQKPHHQEQPSSFPPAPESLRTKARSHSGEGAKPFTPGRESIALARSSSSLDHNSCSCSTASEQTDDCAGQGGAERAQPPFDFNAEDFKRDAIGTIKRLVVDDLVSSKLIACAPWERLYAVCDHFRRNDWPRDITSAIEAAILRRSRESELTPIGRVESTVFKKRNRHKLNGVTAGRT